MRKILLYCFSLCFILTGMAQNAGYVAIKSGLNMREEPGAKGKVITKIPYGEKLKLETLGDTVIHIVTEGMGGMWMKTNWKGKTGYVINTYLLPQPPPRANVKTMKGYLQQLSPKFGKEMLVKNGTMQNISEGGSELRKQLYTNGTEWHGLVAYEYNSDTYFLPDFTVQQGFILLRLLSETPAVIGAADVFPANSGTKQVKQEDCTITVERETWGEPVKACKRLRYEWQEGAYNTIELFMLDGQLVILSSSGV
jgi:hypothetical protein